MANINKTLKLSIIIPTLNEVKRLPSLLADLNVCPYEFELIVADGGSSDKTVNIATLEGAKVIKCSEANRGLQLSEGAIKANGEWLFFLHADCRLDTTWPSKIYSKIKNKYNKKYSWFFNFKVNNKGIIWRLLEFSVYIRSHFLQKPYGDQGLLISKDLYINLGGYKQIHIMEDIDLIIRISKVTKLRSLGGGLTTSSRKFKEGNIIQNAIRNAILRYKWSRGESINELAKKYYYSSNRF